MNSGIGAEDVASPAEKRRWYQRKYYWSTKAYVLEYYGGGRLACMQCGFPDLRALGVDHINGNGHKGEQKVGTESIYYWLKTHDFPSGYQTLCMNCQSIKKIQNGTGKL